MKQLLKWLAKIAATVITIALLIIFFPHISRFARELMPDEAGSAIRARAVLETRLSDSARLETMLAEEDGLLEYDIKAAFIGSVAKITVSYTYKGSFGIDLQKVTVQMTDNHTLLCTLPLPELLQDDLVTKEMFADDFWYPGFTKDDYNRLLTEEQAQCREKFLSGAQYDELLRRSQATFEKTVSFWLAETGDAPQILCQWAASSPDN